MQRYDNSSYDLESLLTNPQVTTLIGRRVEEARFYSPWVQDSYIPIWPQQKSDPSKPQLFMRGCHLPKPSYVNVERLYESDWSILGSWRPRSGGSFQLRDDSFEIVEELLREAGYGRSLAKPSANKTKTETRFPHRPRIFLFAVILLLLLIAWTFF